MSHSMIPFFFLNSGVVYYLIVVPMLWVSAYVSGYFFPVNTASNVFMIAAVFLLQIFLLVALLHFRAARLFF